MDAARSTKQKHSPESNNPSMITTGLSDRSNIQQIAESINGLVGVARLTEICPSRRVGHFKAPC